VPSGYMFNPACFAAPSPGANGSYMMPYMKAQPYFNNDLSLFKNFKLGGDRSPAPGVHGTMPEPPDCVSRQRDEPDAPVCHGERADDPEAPIGSAGVSSSSPSGSCSRPVATRGAGLPPGSARFVFLSERGMGPIIGRKVLCLRPPSAPLPGSS
jgi:hypothetical protein